MPHFTALSGRTGSPLKLAGEGAVPVAPSPLLEKAGGGTTRELVNACELIEAELDSANANCRRQGLRASARAREMAEEAASVAAESRNVAGTAEQASENVAAVAAASDELSAAAREIATQAARSSSVARQAVTASDEAAGAVRDLGQAALAINDVVRSIAAIASRTNLLALNATIEAARAGEAGRGFSVVAAEVKELSRQTAAATQDITTRIRTMQSATSGSVAAMQGVSQAVRDIDNANAAVAAAVEEQEATLRQIAERLRGAATNTTQVAATIGQVAARGTRLGELSQAAHAETARTDALVGDLRGNVLLMLSRVSSLGQGWNQLVPVQRPARLRASGWSGEVMVLEISETAALVRLPPEAGTALATAETGSNADLMLSSKGPLPSRLLAAGNGRVLLQLDDQPSPALSDLAELVARIHTDDLRFAASAQEAAARITACLEEAVAQGSLSMSVLFDPVRHFVPDSDPPQFVNNFTPHADRLIRPILDSLLTFDPGVIGAFLNDHDGYAPTHNSRVSHPQRPGDRDWNAKNCRNRWLFDDRAGLAAGRTTRPYLLQSYERDMGNGERMMIKEADAPIRVNGRHWGGFRLMYRNSALN